MEEIWREALLEIPDDLNLNIPGLSNECREVIMQAKPGNVSPLRLLLAQHDLNYDLFYSYA